MLLGEANQEAPAQAELRPTTSLRACTPAKTGGCVKWRPTSNGCGVRLDKLSFLQSFQSLDQRVRIAKGFGGETVCFEFIFAGSSNSSRCRAAPPAVGLRSGKGPSRHNRKELIRQRLRKVLDETRKTTLRGKAGAE